MATCSPHVSSELLGSARSQTRLLFLLLLYDTDLARGSLTHAGAGLLKAGVHFNIRGHGDPLPSRKRTPGMFSRTICALALTGLTAWGVGVASEGHRESLRTNESTQEQRCSPEAPRAKQRLGQGLASARRKTPKNAAARLGLLRDCSFDTATPGRGQGTALPPQRGAGRAPWRCHARAVTRMRPRHGAKASFRDLERACVILAADPRVTGCGPRGMVAKVPPE